jgi:hypothetical protein
MNIWFKAKAVFLLFKTNKRVYFKKEKDIYSEVTADIYEFNYAVYISYLNSTKPIGSYM